MKAMRKAIDRIVGITFIIVEEYAIFKVFPYTNSYTATALIASGIISSIEAVRIMVIGKTLKG